MTTITPLSSATPAASSLGLKQPNLTSSSESQGAFGNLLNQQMQSVIANAQGIDTSLQQVVAGTANPLTVAPLLAMAEISLKEAHAILNRTTQAFNDLTKTQV